MLVNRLSPLPGQHEAKRGGFFPARRLSAVLHHIFMGKHMAALRFRTGIARGIGRMVALAAMALAGLLAAGVAGAQTYTVARMSHTILLADDAHADAHVCNYAAYRITADAPVTDVWATIGNFAGGRITLAATEDGVVHVGAIPLGQHRTAYFYLCGDTVPNIGEVIPGQTHTVTLWDRDPSLPGATQVGTSNWTLSYAHAHINANSNKIDSVTVDPTDVYLGSTFTIRVDGRTGTVGSDEHLVFSPAAHAAWPAAAFELVASFINLPDVGPDPHELTDDLVHTGFDVNGANTPYYALYTFRVVGMPTTDTETSPYSFIDSGQNLKHTDVSHSVYPVIPPPINSTTLSKSANPTVVVQTGSTTDVTFTVTINNTDEETVTLDEIRDVLPAGFTYAAGTSTFNGGAIGNPLVSGPNLTWTGSFVVPPLSSRQLVFHATLQANPSVGTYDNCVTARIGSTQIDTTADTTDNAPACARVSVIATPPAGGTILIRKTAIGGGATFSYTGTGGAPVGNFSIDASAGSGVQTFTTVPAGAYTITETIPSGWALTAINCTVNPSTAGSATPNVGGGSVSITIGAGNVVVDCEFVNNKRGSITIVKNADPEVGQAFSFSAPSLTPPFDLTPPGTPQQAFASVSPGLYTFTETVPAGWTLDDIECSITTVGTNTTTFAYSGAVSSPTAGFEAGDVTAEITLGWGDQVRCEFYNLQNGSITIVKQTENADGTFVFNTSGPAGGSQVQLVTSGGGAQDTPFLSVPPGTYSITELVPAEWSLRDIVCSSTNGESAFIYTGNPDGPQDTFEPGDTTATIYLGAGDGVLCTYVNRKVPHTAIPTLSEWMLMLLGTLLLAGGAMSLRRRVAGRR